MVQGPFEMDAVFADLGDFDIFWRWEFVLSAETRVSDLTVEEVEFVDLGRVDGLLFKELPAYANAL